MAPKKFDCSDETRSLIIEQIKLRDTRLFGQGLEASKINAAWEEVVTFSKRYVNMYRALQQVWDRLKVYLQYRKFASTARK